MHLISQFKRSMVAAVCLMFLTAGCAGNAKQESTGEFIDDTVITTKVKSELFEHDGLKSLDISVETFKGTVQLSGFVDTEDQRREAESIAELVEGVTDVKNDLVIK